MLKRTYLVTGAAGFIGAAVIRRLLDAGHLVVGVDNLNDYYDVRLKEYRLDRLLQRPGFRNNAEVPLADATSRVERFRFIHADIEDRSALAKIFEECKLDGVINLAARAGVRRSIESPHPYFNTNVIGSLNLLELIRTHFVPRYILASTSSLYAGAPMPFTEDSHVNTPISPYAASKKAAEVLAYTYHALYGIHVCSLRFFTVFGPAGRPDMAPFRFVKWISEGLPVHLNGDGSHARDFTFVSDIADGVVGALQVDGHEIINLGGGGGSVSLLQMIRWIEDLLAARASIIHRPIVAGDMQETRADISKARRLLGWEPRFSVKKGIEETVNWHLQNQELVRSIVV